LRPVQANSSRDSISKITREKWTGDVTHGRVPPLQARSPGFIPQSQEGRKRGREGGKKGGRKEGRKEGIERYKIRVLPPIMDKINFD
jgi:hypothetical protein